MKTKTLQPIRSSNDHFPCLLGFICQEVHTHGRGATMGMSGMRLGNLPSRPAGTLSGMPGYWLYNGMGSSSPVYPGGGGNADQGKEPKGQSRIEQVLQSVQEKKDTCQKGSAEGSVLNVNSNWQGWASFIPGRIGPALLDELRSRLGNPFHNTQRKHVRSDNRKQTMQQHFSTLSMVQGGFEAASKRP